jgi:hypothetical protein
MLRLPPFDRDSASGGSSSIKASILLLSEPMDLYDVKKTGFGSPLNTREISHLIRVGYLHPRVHCKPTGETRWRTIGELFPLLDYGIGGYSLPSEGSKPGNRVTITFGVVAALMAIGAFFYGNRPARDSIGASSAAQSSSNQVAAAAAAAKALLVYSRSGHDSTDLGSVAKSRRQAAAAVVLARND